MMNDEQTHFGFQTVLKNEKTSLVRDLFHNVSSKYDLMNDLMSFGLHKCWKKRFVHKLALAPNQQVLDVACGTADITLLMRQVFPYLNLTSHLADITPAMIEIAQEKAINRGIVENMNWYISAAEDLPFEDNTMDIYTISFGLRNVADREKTLKEALRVLKPGGHFYCLEFSHVQNSFMKDMYDLYSFHVLPFLGTHVAKDRAAYEYLAESIRIFPNATVLENEMRICGFQNVQSELWMNGIVALHQGQK